MYTDENLDPFVMPMLIYDYTTWKKGLYADDGLLGSGAQKMLE